GGAALVACSVRAEGEGTALVGALVNAGTSQPPLKPGGEGVGTHNAGKDIVERPRATGRIPTAVELELRQVSCIGNAWDKRQLRLAVESKVAFVPVQITESRMVI